MTAMPYITAFIIALCLALVPFSQVNAAEKSDEYFASIKANEVNVRTGPNIRYPIKWVYRRQHWPVNVLASFEQWKKIADIDGEEGWVHETLLSSSRYALTNSEGVVKGYRLPIPTAAPVAMLEKGVVVAVDQCRLEWCKIEASGHEVWLESKHLWGVKQNEEVEW